MQIRIDMVKVQLFLPIKSHCYRKGRDVKGVIHIWIIIKNIVYEIEIFSDHPEPLNCISHKSKIFPLYLQFAYRYQNNLMLHLETFYENFSFFSSLLFACLTLAKTRIPSRPDLDNPFCVEGHSEFRKKIDKKKGKKKKGE